MIKLAVAAAAFGLTGPAVASVTTLAEAHDAYDQNRIATAEQNYAAIAADLGRPAEDRAEAQIELARIAWLVDGNADTALARLAAARQAGAKLCEAGWMEARVLREAKRPQQALARSKELVAPCNDAAKRDLIGLQLLRARLDLAASEPARRKAEMEAATMQLRALGPDAAGSLEGAAARLEIGVLTGDPITAQKGWQDYFWLNETDGPPALAGLSPRARFTAGLASHASDDARAQLADLLARSGFAEIARRFSLSIPRAGKSRSPRWQVLDALWLERAKLLATQLQVNRKLARGGSKDDPTLEQAAMQALGGLMQAAGATGDPRQAVLQNFGLLGSVGKTSGYPSMHLGHVIEDRRQTVEQYGHRAEVRFVVIDGMWANGFESWLWDGSGETGGWSSDDMIVHVRPAYANGPVSAFALVGDTAKRREAIAKLPALASEDLAKVKTGAPATMAGLSARLRLQFIDEVAAAVRAKAPADFRRAFLEEYWRASLQHSIFVHEGRHAIDKAIAPDPSKLDSTELEFTAKLSELALADYPRMALWNINRGIGGTSPHEQAATRILGEYAHWVRDHPGQVTGFDSALPAETQIDKLSDDQIRLVARSLDPLARAKPIA